MTKKEVFIMIDIIFIVITACVIIGGAIATMHIIDDDSYDE